MCIGRIDDKAISPSRKARQSEGAFLFTLCCLGYGYRTPMTMPIVFVVSEDAVVCNWSKRWSNGRPASRNLSHVAGVTRRGRTGIPRLLVFYARIGTLSDQEQQARLAAVCARRPGILITERGDVPMAVRALKAGVMDVVQKPYRDKNLLDHIEKALEANSIAHR